MPGYRFDDVEIDADGFRILKRGQPVRLEPKAVELLLFLAANPGRLVGKGEIQEAIWPNTAVTESALTRLVAQIRRVLEDDAREARYIETVPTRGYRFVAELRGPEAGQPAVPGSPEQGDRPASRRPHAHRWTPLALVALVLVAAATTGLWRGARRDATPADALPRPGTETPISQGDGLNAYPSFSPDAADVAFSTQRGRSMEIVVCPRAAGARELAVTSDGNLNVEPAFSPDGRHLAYHSVARGGIWLVPALGGVSRQLTTFGSSPAWSPDGS